VADAREKDCLAEHFVNFLQPHANALKNLHGLAPKETMFDPINLRKRSFTQKAFHFVGIADHLAIFEQAHNRENTWRPEYQKYKNQQSSNADVACDVFLSHFQIGNVFHDDEKPARFGGKSG
jgi:hypothetical protein